MTKTVASDIFLKHCQEGAEVNKHQESPVRSAHLPVLGSICPICTVLSPQKFRRLMSQKRLCTCSKHLVLDKPMLLCLKCRRYHLLDETSLLLYVQDIRAIDPDIQQGLLIVQPDWCLTCQSEVKGTTSPIIIRYPSAPPIHGTEVA